MPGSNSLLVRSQKDSAQYDRLKVQNLKVTNALNTNNVISDKIFVFENFYLYNATLNVDSNTITANKDNILATIWSDRPNKIKINLSDNDVVELLRASFDDSIGNYSFKNNNPNMIVMINNSVVILTLIDYSVMGDEVTFFYENNFNSQIVDNYTGKISIFIDSLPLDSLPLATFFKIFYLIFYPFLNLRFSSLLTFKLVVPIEKYLEVSYFSRSDNEFTYRLNIKFEDYYNEIIRLVVTLSLGNKQIGNIEKRNTDNYDIGILNQYINIDLNPQLISLEKDSNEDSNSNFNFASSFDDMIRETIENKYNHNWKLFTIQDLSGPTNKFTYQSNSRNGNSFNFGAFTAIFETEYIRINKVNNALSVIQINLGDTNLLLNNIEQIQDNYTKEFFGIVYYQSSNLDINENSVLRITTNGPINN